MDPKALLLEGLETSLVQGDEAQVSHGLNLVLELKLPTAMPLLLAKIEQARRKINAGLSELNFVHYARFLPVHDNAALQVITEFDGPLAPYVLDFIIEIGDVFNMLLGFTKGTDHIVPVAHHPAEFLAFVEKHNTVKVGPAEFADWPVYAAYPEATVLEIVGPRNDLPLPKADRWPTPVQRDDVQGNILRGYGAQGVRHFVLRVVDARKARDWLAGKATADEQLAATLRVTSFKRWTNGKPNLMLNIGLTSAGMHALGVRESWLARFPEAFREGALHRAEGNFDTGSNAPEHWWLGGPGDAHDIHVLVSLYYAPGAEEAFAAAAGALTDSLAGGGLALLASHAAAYRDGKSWFGYADGIAKPRIAVECPNPDAPADLQPAATPGEFVLGADYKNIYGGDSLGTLPAELATNGSFCAVRVLAQEATAFKETVRDEAKRLNVDADWLAAKLMGRWYEGAPVSLHPHHRPTDPAENERNDFDYEPSYEYPHTPEDHAGEACPMGAHIRRSNPRTARIAGARYARRLMRRGMHYQITDGPNAGEVGLFGIFICADLERQFEFIQRQWINGDRFAAGLRGTRDPFIGTPRAEIDTFTVPVANGEALQVRLPQFVRTRGSLYLFMPGLAALRQLDRFATTDPSPRTQASSQDAAWRREPPHALRIDEHLFDAVAPHWSAEKLFTIAGALRGALPLRSKAVRPPVSPQNLRFDPRKRSFQADPYPVYAAFRKNEPVHYSPLFGGWFVFGYDDVVEVCQNDSLFSAAHLDSTAPRALFTLDEPEHGQVLQRVAAAWKAAAVDTDKIVARSIERTLAAIGERSCFDLVDDFARPIPRDVYFDILGGKGIDAEERLVLDALARRVMKSHDHTLNQLQGLDGTLAGAELGARLGAMLIRAGLPLSPYEGSFLEHLARAVDGTLNPTVALVTLLNLTVAGYMSVEFLLATGVRRLLVDEGHWWEVLKKDPPKTLPPVLEEMRRTDHALSVVDRFAKQDLVLSDCRIPKGACVFGVLASANRDEKIFGPDADRFDPFRTSAKQQLGLGWGTHICMGRYLEPRISGPAISRLLDVMPGLRLQSAAQPAWFENFYFRSFDHLAVNVK